MGRSLWRANRGGNNSGSTPRRWWAGLQGSFRTPPSTLARRSTTRLPAKWTIRRRSSNAVFLDGRGMRVGVGRLREHQGLREHIVPLAVEDTSDGGLSVG